MTYEKIRDKDMRHCHFLKAPCDIGGPRSRAPDLLGRALWESDISVRPGIGEFIDKVTEWGSGRGRGMSY